MSSTKLVLAGVAAAALLAVLWWQRRDDGPAAALGPASAPAAAVERPRADGAAAAAVAAESPPLKPADARPGEVELSARASEETYARIGGVLVDHLAARGLSRADAEPVVRRFIDDNCSASSTRCARWPTHKPCRTTPCSTRSKPICTTPTAPFSGR